MAAENIGSLYNTKIPGYEDAADIQAALKLFLYGSTTYDVNNTDPNQLPNPSLARHLKDLQDDINTLDELGTGSTLSATEPTASLLPLNGAIPNGFIWVDSSQSANNSVGYLTAVYSNEAPTTNLVDGLIWIDKDASPIRAFVYNAGTSSWDVFNQLENLIDNAGDIIYGSSDNTYAKLPIGSNGQVLTVNSGLPSWSVPKSWVLKSSAQLSGTGINVSGLNGEKIFIALKDWSHDNITEPVMLSIRFNNDFGLNYVNTGGLISASSLHSPVFMDDVSHDLTIEVDLANSISYLKPVSTIADNSSGQYFGYYKNTSPITSVQVSLSPSGNFDVGYYQVWSYE